MATLITNDLQISLTFKIHKIMATSKSFFGKRRGSTKNFTFAVFNGKQVTKEKAEQVKNPRTLAQMKNRMILTTSSAAYAAMKEIVDHSFQGYVYGLQNMSRFQSVNNKLLRDNLEAATSQFAYANYGDARVLPGAYVISEGSLAPIPSAMFACAISAANSVAFTIQPGVTAAELTANAIISALGLQVGELATLCFLADCGTEAGYKFGFIRLTVKAAGDMQLTAQNLTEYFTIESNAPVALTSVADGTAVITATIDGVQAAGGLCYGCIHSANENGSWKRSDTTMTIAAGTLLEPTATQAIATYPVGGSKILNNGDIPGGHAAPTPPNNNLYTRAMTDGNKVLVNVEGLLAVGQLDGADACAQLLSGPEQWSVRGEGLSTYETECGGRVDVTMSGVYNNCTIVYGSKTYVVTGQNVNPNVEDWQG